MTIKQLISKARAITGLSLPKLAAKIGVSARSMQFYVAGKQRMRAETLMKLQRIVHNGEKK